jgi:hypothetical protein
MKKTLFLIIFGFITNYSVSQKIEYTYIYKVEKVKSRFGSGVKWNYLDLDSLVIYKNGTFHQTKVYHYHQFSYTEFNGKWNIKNDTLFLDFKEMKQGKTEKIWETQTLKLAYRIKRNKIKLIGEPDYYRRKKLKIVSE